jgi:sugar phosphate isomerase/epimerase
MDHANFGIATGAFVDEREVWTSAVGRAAAEGWPFLELTAGKESRLETLLPLLHEPALSLEEFRRVSVHAPVRFRTSVADVAPKIAAVAERFDVIVHPDVYRDEAWLHELGSRVVFENMDATKRFGATVDDLQRVFETFPGAGFCLDVAHVWTNDPSLSLAHELLDRFGHRLRQLHVSGIKPDGEHRPTTDADLAPYQPVLERCADVPWLLETELVGDVPHHRNSYKDAKGSVTSPAATGG